MPSFYQDRLGTNIEKALKRLTHSLTRLDDCVAWWFSGPTATPAGLTASGHVSILLRGCIRETPGASPSQGWLRTPMPAPATTFRTRQCGTHLTFLGPILCIHKRSICQERLGTNRGKVEKKAAFSAGCTGDRPGLLSAVAPSQVRKRLIIIRALGFAAVEC